MIKEVYEMKIVSFNVALNPFYEVTLKMKYACNQIDVDQHIIMYIKGQSL